LKPLVKTFVPSLKVHQCLLFTKVYLDDTRGVPARMRVGVRGWVGASNQASVKWLSE
jgi:hypothetical protein